MINLASNITKRLRGILNAWQFWFKVKFLCVWHNGLVLGLRCSPLNAALVANEENAAKAGCLELKSVCFWWGFVLQF